MEKVLENKKKKGIKNPMPYIKSKVCCSTSCREVRNILAVIALIVVGFYGLVWIPSKQLELDKLKFEVARQNYSLDLGTVNLNLAKVQNSCKMVASNSLAAYEKQAGDKKLSEEDKKKIYGNFYLNCLFVEGIQVNQGAQKK